jgi:hypothetical protein
VPGRYSAQLSWLLNYAVRLVHAGLVDIANNKSPVVCTPVTTSLIFLFCKVMFMVK